MKRTKVQRIVCFVLAVVLLVGGFTVTSSASKLEDRWQPTGLSQMQAYLNASSYEEYLATYADSRATGLSQIVIPATDYVPDGTAAQLVDQDWLNANVTDASLWTEFGDSNIGNVVYLPASGKVEWNVTLDDSQKGLYYIRIEYYNCQTAESSIGAIERKLYIDDGIPFTEASYITMPKHWQYQNVVTELSEAASSYIAKNLKEDGTFYATLSDGYYKFVKSGADVTTYRISQDINGNSMSPETTQYSVWSTYYCQDSTGYYDEYFRFNFLNGSHTITLEAQREPVIVRSITLVPVDDEKAAVKTYAEVLAEYAQSGYTAANGKVTLLEAEFPNFVSDASVTAANNNSSSATYPSTARAQLYNVVGETGFSTVGQWAAYTFTVDATGLYKIGMRFSQSTLQGMFACRSIKLSSSDGKYGDGLFTPTLPFAEAANARFNYEDDWQSAYIGDGVTEVVGTDKKGNPIEEERAFEFYFEEGVEYTLYVEVALGSLKKLIQKVENAKELINDCYLRILQLTGSSPDEYAYYNFLGNMPDVLVTLCEQAVVLDEVSAEFTELCGFKGAHIATLDTIARLLDEMGADDGDNIAKNMSNLKSYLGTLGTWINDSKQSTVIVDSIVIAPSDAGEDALPAVKAGFFKNLWFEIKAFIFSFFTDYNAMGLTVIPEEGASSVQVWLASGRDQSNIWRTMIDAKGSFTDTTGVAVNLKLVTGGTLLPSILSGKGPDVYFSLGASDVINYAIRDAIIGINGKDTENLSAAENAVFTTSFITYSLNGKSETVAYSKEPTAALTRANGVTRDGQALTVYTAETIPAGAVVTGFTDNFNDVIGYGVNPDGSVYYTDDTNYVKAAMDTVQLLGVTYGVPETMSMAMMFYRADILAKLDASVPETWAELLALLPVLQANNMTIGVSYGSALTTLLYQMNSSMWKYTDNDEYAGAKINLDDDRALESFEYVCRLYSDYSFPVSFDAANRFRTGEMPLIVSDYAGMYNQLVVYATEIEGLWEFCAMPGWYTVDESYKTSAHWNTEENYYYNYNSIAGVSAAVILHGCDNLLEAWQFLQWQTSASVQANYGNRMVALIGPSAKYEAANIHAIKNLSWTASEVESIMDQIRHLDSVVNYPGSYIIDRYTKFAFLAAANNGADAVDSLTGYIAAINTEITRKREEFGLKTLATGEEPDYLKKD